MLLAYCTVKKVLYSKLLAAIFARCHLGAAKLFWLFFFKALGYIEAQVSCLKWFGGQPNRKDRFCFRLNVVDGVLAGTIKGGYRTCNS